jgi:sarcosine oxidase
MESVHWKNVIVGAGAMGSAAAYQLAKRGEPVLLIEQFEIGHDRGSSHGAARITRHSYADARYARLMPAAFRAWRTLEADLGEALYIRTGGVSFSPEHIGYATQVAGSLSELDVPHWHTSGRDWNARHPVFSLPDDYDVVFEPDAGMVRASRAVVAQVELAQRFGGSHARVMSGTPVQAIDLEGTHPVLITDSARITADRLIVSAGGWLHKLLPSLSVPQEVTHQQVLYFRPADPVSYSIGRFPVFIHKGEADEPSFYGMPEFQGLGVKVARHGGPEVEPDRDSRVVGDEYREVVRGFLRTHIAALAGAAIDLTEVCLYTVAPDDQFLVDFLPGRDDLIVASPCSGHGFKFSALVGRILAELATEGKTGFAIDFWKMLAQ